MLLKRFALSSFQYKFELLSEVFVDLDVKVIAKRQYDKLRSKAAREIRLNEKDLEGKIANLEQMSSDEILVLDHVPKPINLLELRREKVLNLFRVRNLIREAVATFFANLPADTTLIGVHVRLTDKKFFLRKQAGGARQFRPKEILYIMNEAFESIGESSAAFLIASDDPKWCKENLGSQYKDRTIYFTSDAYPSLSSQVSEMGFDFWAMSSCRHNVVLIGTFAFWASFFAGGRVFLPLDYPKQTRRVHQSAQIARASLTTNRYHNIVLPPFSIKCDEFLFRLKNKTGCV